MSSGPQGWAQPQGERPFFDGTQLGASSPIRREPVAGGAHRLLMWDGTSVVQRPFLAAARSAAPQFYEFSWEQDGAVESEWRLIEKARARGSAVNFIPHLTDHEVWECAAGTNNFTLSRPTALSVEAGFDTVTHPNLAFLDGSALTIVTSGSPASGEVDIQGSAVITASDVTVGQVLEILYYPSYSVLVPRLGSNLQNFNDLRREVLALEAA